MSDTENLRFNAYVDAMITGDFDNKTQGEMAILLGVSERTIYEWKKKADWPAIKDARRKLYSHEIMKVDTAMLKAANSGDTQAAKIVYERFDGWVPTTGLKIGKDIPDSELLAAAEAEKRRILGEEDGKQAGPDLSGAGAAATP